MTLDETIKNYQSVVNAFKRQADRRLEGKAGKEYIESAKKTYEEYNQFLEWLKELKAWREGKIVQSANVNTETLIFNTEDLTSIPEIKSRPEGKWIEVLTKDGCYYECSECGQRLNWVDENDHYCCRCGSRNDEGL